MSDAALTNEQLNALRALGTCVIANAVETFHVRLRNTGFTNGNVQCMFPEMPAMVGYAVTARLRSGEPPISGVYRDRSDLWNKVLELPAPRVLVLEDLDRPSGRGAFIGDMHAAILKALHCPGYVTNGAVRELNQVRAIGIQLFGGNLAVSHAYAHIFDIGATVTIDGMEVHSGDLLLGDQHGVINIPIDIAPSIPDVAAGQQRTEKEVIELCESGKFTVDRLGEMMKKGSGS